MNTEPGGTTEIEIPVLIGPDGFAHGWVTQKPDGEHSEDIGLLYDSFIDREYPPQAAKLITVRAEVDLESLFADTVIEGEVETDE